MEKSATGEATWIPLSKRVVSSPAGRRGRVAGVCLIEFQNKRRRAAAETAGQKGKHKFVSPETSSANQRSQSHRHRHEKIAGSSGVRGHPRRTHERTAMVVLRRTRSASRWGHPSRSGLQVRGGARTIAWTRERWSCVAGGVSAGQHS